MHNVWRKNCPMKRLEKNPIITEIGMLMLKSLMPIKCSGRCHVMKRSKSTNNVISNEISCWTKNANREKETQDIFPHDFMTTFPYNQLHATHWFGSFIQECKWRQCMTNAIRHQVKHNVLPFNMLSACSASVSFKRGFTDQEGATV